MGGGFQKISLRRLCEVMDGADKADFPSFRDEAVFPQPC
jgi:hypothetical protein